MPDYQPASPDHKPSVRQTFFACRLILESLDQPFNAATVSDLISRLLADPSAVIAQPTPSKPRRKTTTPTEYDATTPPPRRRRSTRKSAKNA